MLKADTSAPGSTNGKNGNQGIRFRCTASVAYVLGDLYVDVMRSVSGLMGEMSLNTHVSLVAIPFVPSEFDVFTRDVRVTVSPIRVGYFPRDRARWMHKKNFFLLSLLVRFCCFCTLLLKTDLILSIILRWRLFSRFFRLRKSDYFALGCFPPRS